MLNHGRAAFDWQCFSRDCRAALSRANRGYRALAEEIGVTISDLSRAAGGANVSVEKVFAICDFIGVDARRYYRKPMKSDCFTGTNVKQPDVSRAASPPAGGWPSDGRANGRGLRSQPRPAAEGGNP
jgi:hypothetical protein